MEVTKFGFKIVIGRPDNGSDIRHAFVTMRYERSGKYTKPTLKLKRDDTIMRKCGCPFKVCGYRKANSAWKFNVVSGKHNHDFCYKLADHPFVCLFNPE